MHMRRSDCTASLTRRRISRGVLGSSPRKCSDFASRRQDFQHILKRISLEIAVFIGFFRNKAISFTFPSIFRNFLQISFRFEFRNNFLQLEAAVIPQFCIAHFYSAHLITYNFIHYTYRLLKNIILRQFYVTSKHLWLHSCKELR